MHSECSSQCLDIVGEFDRWSIDADNERLYDCDPDPDLGDSESACGIELITSLRSIQELSESHDGSLGSTTEAHDRIVRHATDAILKWLPHVTDQNDAEMKKLIATFMA